MEHTQAPSIQQTQYVDGITASKILGISYSHLRRLLRTGAGPRHIQLGGARRFSVETLHAFMREHEK